MREEIFYTNKDIKDTKIAIIADIHYSPTFKDKILDNIAKQINTAKPDYLIIAGDILDRSNYEYQKIIDFLKNISQIATVIITLGNHDTYVKSSNGKVVNGINEDFINKIKQINNTYILRDEKIIIDNICFYGFDLSFYHFIKDKESYSSFCQEIPNLKIKLDDNNYNITIVHSPVNIYRFISENPNCNLAKSNLIISGHTHNGILPYWITNIINKIFKTNRSLASPYRFIFPKYAQGRVYKPVDGIIYEGLLKLSRSSGILNIFDFIFHKKIKLITIKKRKTE